MQKGFFQSSLFLAVAVLFGLLAGCFETPLTWMAANAVSEVFINLLKLVSLPIIFLSLVSTASSMENADEMRFLGTRVVKYTLITTLIAASIALGLFLLVNPVGNLGEAAPVDIGVDGKGYLKYLLEVIPSNVVQPFSEHNVVGVLILALLLSFALLALPVESRKTLHQFFSSLFAAVMKITTWIVQLMPFAICAFVALFVHDIREGLDWRPVAGYLGCVVAANFIQALIVLPVMVKLKGISPLKLARAMAPALSLAFFSKSSSAALPVAVQCATERFKMNPRMVGFSFPLCTTINMNACAAFILTTVLFVSMSHGVTYTPLELFVWIFVATIAAIGNAGVPMGCFFLASAFLAAMNVPLHVLGIILPFYNLIDMAESAINVWSDSCVTAVVAKEVADEESAGFGILNAAPIKI